MSLKANYLDACLQSTGSIKDLYEFMRENKMDTTFVGTPGKVYPFKGKTMLDRPIAKRLYNINAEIASVDVASSGRRGIGFSIIDSTFKVS